MLSPATTSPPRPPAFSYFAVFCDYGRRGLEATVCPELTRSNIVDRIKSGDYECIVRIDHVADGLVEDVTCELIDEAEAALKDEAIARYRRAA